MKIAKEPIFVTTADNKQLDINKYLPLVKNIVYKVSSKLIKSSELYLDLQGAGYVGLIEAAKNYDSTKAAFTTFAYSHIKGRILRALTHERKEDHTLDSQLCFAAGTIDDTHTLQRGVAQLRKKSIRNTADFLYSSSCSEEETINDKVDFYTINQTASILFAEESIEKKIFILRYIEERTFRDISNILNLHYKTIEAKDKFIIQKIKEHLSIKNEERINNE